MLVAVGGHDAYMHVAELLRKSQHCQGLTRTCQRKSKTRLSSQGLHRRLQAEQLELAIVYRSTGVTRFRAGAMKRAVREGNGRRGEQELDTYYYSMHADTGRGLPGNSGDGNDWGPLETPLVRRGHYDRTCPVFGGSCFNKADLKDGSSVVAHLGASAASATRPRSSPMHACPPKT